MIEPASHSSSIPTPGHPTTGHPTTAATGKNLWRSRNCAVSRWPSSLFSSLPRSLLQQPSSPQRSPDLSITQKTARWLRKHAVSHTLFPSFSLTCSLLCYFSSLLFSSLVSRLFSVGSSNFSEVQFQRFPNIIILLPYYSITFWFRCASLSCSYTRSTLINSFN